MLDYINEDVTVDELFSKLTIPQIQNLNEEYKENGKLAKEDLRKLVSQHYRDLIRIAVDIGHMYTKSGHIEQDLCDLSLNSSKVITNETSIAKYNTTIRRRRLSALYKEEQNNIFRSIVNKKLLIFDLKLSSLSCKVPFEQTSVVVYYAKLFWTMEHVFADTLSVDTPSVQDFHRIRRNFIKYLESELASYSHLADHFLSRNGENFDITQRFNGEELLKAQDNQEVFDEENELDFDLDVKIDLHLMYRDDPNRYFNKIPPILNFLVAYLLINCSNKEFDSLTKVLDKFLELRFNFLESICTNLKKKFGELETFQQLSYAKIFFFIKNTCRYVHDYLLNENFKLKFSWRPTSVISLPALFDNKELEFDVTKEFSASHKESYEKACGKVAEFSSLLMGISSFAVKKASELSHGNYDELTNILILTFNYLLNLKYLTKNKRNLSMLEFFSANLARHGTNQDDAFVLIQGVVSRCDTVFDLQLQALYVEDVEKSIICIINEDVRAVKKGTQRGDFNLFSKDMNSLMDNDIDGYVHLLDRLSKDFVVSRINDNLLEWFDMVVAFLDLLEVEADNTWLRSKPKKQLQKMLESLDKLEKNQNDGLRTEFLSLMKEKFKYLNENFRKKFKHAIDLFLVKLQTCLSQNQDFCLKYYFLGLFSFVKDRLSYCVLKFPDLKGDIEDSLSSLDLMISSLVYEIVHVTPTRKVFNGDYFVNAFKRVLQESIEEAISKEIEIDSYAPRKLSSLLLTFTDKITHPSSNDLFQMTSYSDLFINRYVIEDFIKFKNEWILEDLILKSILERLHEIIDAYSRVYTSSESEKLKEKVLAQIFSFCLYLHCFTTKQPVNNLRDPPSQKYFNTLNNDPGLKDALKESTAEEVLSHVQDFYKGSQQMYIPLLLT